MRTVRISIPALSDARHAQDLSNALIGISGIVHIGVDIPSHTLVVEYDPDLLDPEALKTFVERAGYPIEKDSSDSPRALEMRAHD